MTATQPPAPKRTRRKGDAVITLPRLATVLAALPGAARARALVALSDPPDESVRRCEAVLRQLSMDDRKTVVGFLRTSGDVK